jgi:hypothetical protein
MTARGYLKIALGSYAALILLEGVLRKWVFPEFSDALFVVRDPLVLLIYALAWNAGLLRWQASLALVWLLAVLSLLFALAADTPLAVAVFGLRTNYLHLPLVFVLADAFDRSDVRRFGRAFLLTAPAVAALMIVQFNSPADAFINTGVGGREAGQLTGALGRIRPPGPFSFISGLVAYFAFVAAFVLDGWLQRARQGRIVLLLATIAVAVALPVSISRSLMFALIVVAGFGLAAAVRDPRRLPGYTAPFAIATVVTVLIAGTVYLEAFQARWNEAIIAGGGDFETNVTDRMVAEFTQPFASAAEAPWTGHGIGLGTVAGARLATGKHEFLLAETEWTRIVLELGPLLGFAFIGWRVWLALLMVVRSWRAFLADGDGLAWLLAGAAFFPVFSGQWGPSTHLGFAVFGAGLCLAASKPVEDAAPVDGRAAPA